jgi:hypothetical protein
MLRAIAYGFALVLLTAGVVGIVLDGMPALPLALLPAALLIGLLCERYLYKPLQDVPPADGWERTEERFVDPKTGRLVSVYYNPRTGERRYVADG